MYVLIQEQGWNVDSNGIGQQPLGDDGLGNLLFEQFVKAKGSLWSLLGKNTFLVLIYNFYFLS